jgi:S-phase kinase-associated protein 1
MVLLVTSDNEQFHAEKDVVERSVLIKNMLEGLGSLSLALWPTAPHPYKNADVGETDQPIPLPNVSSSVLKKVF